MYVVTMLILMKMQLKHIFKVSILLGGAIYMLMAFFHAMLVIFMKKKSMTFIFIFMMKLQVEGEIFTKKLIFEY
jgi:hypothetical protein